MPLLREITLPTVGTIHLAIEPNLWLLVFAAGLIVVTSVICGLIPALRATQKGLVGHLQRGAGSGTTGRLWLRHAMVVGQVAVSVVLLVVSLLFLRTLTRLTAIDTGIDLDHGIVATVDLQPGRYTSEQVVLATRDVLERLESTPGVQSTSLADILPRGQDASGNRFETEGTVGLGPRAFVNSVGSKYFETMGIPILRGREFQTGDIVSGPRVVIVSQAFVDAYFPNAEAIGRRVRAGQNAAAVLQAQEQDAFSEIVGVVADSNYRQIGEAPQPLLYYAYAQRSVSTQTRPLRIHVRTAGPPEALVRTVGDIVASFDRETPVRVTTLREATAFEYDFRRATTLMLAVLGSLGLLLAMVGLYGTVSYLVSARTREIGVRMSLGASQATVLWSVLRQGLKLTACGAAIGLAVSLMAGRLLIATLAGLSPADPLALGSTVALLLVAALGATYLPAKRATRVQPIIALRTE
jgi:predicted permease